MTNKRQLTADEVRAAENIAKIQLYLRQKADLNLSAEQVDTITEQFNAINKLVRDKERPRPATDFNRELEKLAQQLSNAMKTKSSQQTKIKEKNALGRLSGKQQEQSTVAKMSPNTSDQSKASQVKEPPLSPQSESEARKVRFSDVTQSARSSASKKDSSEINLTRESVEELARMEEEIFNPVISDQEMKDYNERKRSFTFKISSDQEMTVRRSLVMKSDELTTLADDTVQIKMGDSTFSIPKTPNGITVTVKTPIENLEAEIKRVFEEFPEAIHTATSTGTEERATLDRVRGVMNITSTAFDEMIRLGKGSDNRTNRIDRTMDIYKALMGYTSDKAENLRDRRVLYDPAPFNALQAKIEVITKKNPLSNEDKTEVQRLMGQLNSMTTMLEQRAASLMVQAQGKNSAFSDSVPMTAILQDKTFVAMGDVIRIERSRTDALAKTVEELVGPEMQESKDEAAQIPEVPSSQEEKISSKHSAPLAQAQSTASDIPFGEASPVEAVRKDNVQLRETDASIKAVESAPENRMGRVREAVAKAKYPSDNLTAALNRLEKLEKTLQGQDNATRELHESAMYTLISASAAGSIRRGELLRVMGESLKELEKKGAASQNFQPSNSGVQSAVATQQVLPTFAQSPMPKYPPSKPVTTSEEPVALDRQMEGRLKAAVTLMKAKLKELQPEALEKIKAQTAAQIKGLNDFQGENHRGLSDGMKKQCAAMIKNLKTFMGIAEGQRKNATVGGYGNALNNLANISKYMLKSEDMSYLRKNIAVLKEAIQITMIQQSKVEGKDKKIEVKGDLKVVLDAVQELDKRLKKVENALPMFKGFRKGQFNDQLKKMGQDPIKQALTNIMANKNPDITPPVPPRDIAKK